MRVFQAGVWAWAITCFGEKRARNFRNRNHRFLEEALELVQANGCTKDEAHQLVDYVFNRPLGGINQEAGGVMVTLSALLTVAGEDMDQVAYAELARVWSEINTIRKKDAAKPEFSS